MVVGQIAEGYLGLLWGKFEVVYAFNHHIHPWPELLIPDNANVFYAMSPAAPGDFVLRRKEGARPTTTVSSP